jgi:hypothetical protein
VRPERGLGRAEGARRRGAVGHCDWAGSVLGPSSLHGMVQGPDLRPGEGKGGEWCGGGGPGGSRCARRVGRGLNQARWPGLVPSGAPGVAQGARRGGGL